MMEVISRLKIGKSYQFDNQFIFYLITAGLESAITIDFYLHFLAQRFATDSFNE